MIGDIIYTAHYLVIEGKYIYSRDKHALKYADTEANRQLVTPLAIRYGAS